jgi:hypothetical protein
VIFLPAHDQIICSTSCLYYRSWCNSVSAVSDYRLDDRGSNPAEAKDCSSSLCVQTSSEARPPPFQWVTGVLSRGVQRGRGVTLTTHSIQCRGQERVGAILNLPLVTCMAIAGQLYFTSLCYIFYQRQVSPVSFHRLECR